ncbi:MAG: hypothetical protein QXH07_05370 [Thermoplasmata archaeon]
MPKESVIYSLGGLALIDLVERDYRFFFHIFGNIRRQKNSIILQNLSCTTD